MYVYIADSSGVDVLHVLFMRFSACHVVVGRSDWSLALTLLSLTQSIVSMVKRLSKQVLLGSCTLHVTYLQI